MILTRLLLLIFLRLACVGSLLAGLYMLAFGDVILAILLLWSVPNWLMATGTARRSLYRRRRVLALRAYRIAHLDCCNPTLDETRWNGIVENFHTI